MRALEEGASQAEVWAIVHAAVRAGTLWSKSWEREPLPPSANKKAAAAAQPAHQQQQQQQTRPAPAPAPAAAASASSYGGGRGGSGYDAYGDRDRESASQQQARKRGRQEDASASAAPPPPDTYSGGNSVPLGQRRPAPGDKAAAKAAAAVAAEAEAAKKAKRAAKLAVAKPSASSTAAPGDVLNRLRMVFGQEVRRCGGGGGGVSSVRRGPASYLPRRRRVVVDPPLFADLLPDSPVPSQEPLTEADWDRLTIRGTCTTLEKRYFRLIAVSSGREGGIDAVPSE